MLKCTSGEFTLILSLLEILFPNICLFLFITVYIKIHSRYKCVCWFLGLVLGQSMCRGKFGLIAVIFIFICIDPLNASKKCLYLCAFSLQWIKLVACCPNRCFLVSRTSGYCWASFEV
jgi:hypothetical protein